MSKYITWILYLTLSIAPVIQAADEHDHHETKHDHGEHGNEVTLTSTQRRSAEIKIETLQRRSLAGEIAAPGEVKRNAYLTGQVTPRIAAQVIERHARLGDHVQQGQPLVTLSSVEMAEAQGDLQVAEREWQRVRKLGRATVSDRRYTEARVARDQARARAIAYGMTTEQIDALLTGEEGARADGAFQLVASRAGTVIQDDFIEGEFVEPGRVLFEISDETRVWVEASLMPEEAIGIEKGSPARVRLGGEWLTGVVIQSHHAVNETTRTLAVRIEVPNPDERLHPGLFVETRIEAGRPVDVLALPEEAVLRSPDGDWMIFVEDEPNRYRPVEVKVTRNVQGLTVIAGIPTGTRVVTQGAFFLQSELAKSGFEMHNH
jgi:membrane fusion protein, heavy metal efflux system